MRHRVAHRKLGVVTEHRIAMLRNQASALIEHGRIETTVARGKELRPFVERIITIAKRSVKAGDTGIHAVNARRAVARDILDRAVVSTLFEEVAPRYVDRQGGYTRLLRLGHRRGDSAEVAQVELIGSEFDPSAKTATDKAAAADGGDQPKKKGVGSRIREALGGRKKTGDPAGGGKVDKAAKGGGRITTPRKSGGA
jgi:large subunit ribosomal protein L17